MQQILLRLLLSAAAASATLLEMSVRLSAFQLPKSCVSEFCTPECVRVSMGFGDQVTSKEVRIRDVDPARTTVFKFYADDSSPLANLSVAIVGTDPVFGFPRICDSIRGGVPVNFEQESVEQLQLSGQFCFKAFAQFQPRPMGPLDMNNNNNLDSQFQSAVLNSTDLPATLVIGVIVTLCVLFVLLLLCVCYWTGRKVWRRSSANSTKSELIGSRCDCSV